MGIRRHPISHSKYTLNIFLLELLDREDMTAGKMHAGSLLIGRIDGSGFLLMSIRAMKGSAHVRNTKETSSLLRTTRNQHTPEVVPIVPAAPLREYHRPSTLRSLREIAPCSN